MDISTITTLTPTPLPDSPETPRPAPPFSAPLPPPPPAPSPTPSFASGSFNPGIPTPSAAPTVVFKPQTTVKKSLPAKNIILVGVLLLILAGAILSFGKVRSFLSQAEGSCAPDGLVETNLTANSVEITFQTAEACQAEVAYGVSSEAMLLQVPEAMASLNHRVRLSPLLPGTTYYYQVVAEGKKMGTARSFLTKMAVTPTQVPAVAPTVIPTEAPVPAATGSAYTLADFEPWFGKISSTFDIDKNGIVNLHDWLIYQKK